ncbi:MAG: hypothetical protein FJ245_08240 [Nitrospira sp.]|nr:hypothetical protein [Nitrospira sp.]
MTRQVRSQGPAGTIATAALALGLFLAPAQAVEESSEVFVPLGHAGGVRAVAFSPDGKWALSGSEDQTLRLWEAATGREVRTFVGHAEAITFAVFSPDGRQILSSSYDRTLKLWDAATGREIRTFRGHGEGVWDAAFSPDGKWALSGSADQTMKLWNLATGDEVRTFTGHQQAVTDVDFSPDGKLAVSGSVDQTIKLWKVGTGEEVRTFKGHAQGITVVAFSPDGRRLISSSEDQTLRLWDVKTGLALRTFSGHVQAVISVAFSPDGTQVLSASQDQTLKLWDVATGREQRAFLGHTEAVVAVAFSPDGTMALSGSEDQSLKLWDLATGRELRTFAGVIREARDVAFSPDGRWVLTGSRDSTLKLWELATGRALWTLRGHDRVVTSVAFSPDGKVALSGSDDRTLKLWDVATGRELRTFRGHAWGVTAVAFSPDGKWALSGSGDQTVRLWDVATGKEVRTLAGHAQAVWAVAFSPDGKWALSGSGDQTVRLWDMATGRTLRTMTGHTQAVRAVDFSPDGKLAASGSVDRTIKLWEAATGRETQTFSGHEDSIWAVTFSPDGKQLLSGGEDQTIKLWQVQTGQELRTFRGHNGVVVAASFSSDGRTLLSGSLDGTMRLWEIATGQAVAMLVGFRDGEWIIMTPEGYYTASEHGDEHMIARIGSRVYGLDRFRATFYKPAAVEAAIRLGSSAQGIAQVLGGQKSVPTVASLRELEPPAVTVSAPSNGARLETLLPVLAVHVEGGPRPVRKVQVYVNGERQVLSAEETPSGVGSSAKNGSCRPTGDRSTRRLDDGVPEVSETLHGRTAANQAGPFPIPASLLAGSAGGPGATAAGCPDLGHRSAMDLNLPLRLQPGDNVVEVFASNGFAEERRSLRLTVLPPTAAAAQVKPDLWVLAIGVNAYQDSHIPPLPYAGQDAEALVQALTQQRGKIFRDVHAFVLADMAAAQPTGENIRRGLSRLEQARPGDIVLLFLAGHGAEDRQGEFLFLPRDARLRDGGGVDGAISWREFQPLLDLPARKLIFVDTCYWESIGEHKARGVDNEQLSKDLQEFNAVSYTSCRGTERAVQQEAWSDGALAKALIHGLRGKADLSRDQVVTLEELDAYVTEAVPLLTNGAQYPVTHTPEGYQHVPIALVD